MDVRRKPIMRQKPEWCSFTKRTMIRLRRGDPSRYNRLVNFLFNNNFIEPNDD